VPEVAGDQGKDMQSQRETQTDSLASIIQILQLGYRSGTLSVERDAGQTIEEGYIVFVNGRAVDARTNNYTGLAAFNYLRTWESCRVSFINANDTNGVSPAGPYALNRNRASPNHAGAPFLSGLAPPTDAPGKAAPSPFPRRTQAGEAALSRPESASLQRAQRRLLLLINGQRNVTELARLMARNPDEVQVMLEDLERAGFLQQ
jgi:hypothetical protein